MKLLTVRLPEPLAADIDAESRRRRLTRSDVVRERLSLTARTTRRPQGPPASIADLVGSVDGPPADLSRRKKEHLRATGYGRNHSR